MKTLTNNDLFVYLRNSSVGFHYQEEMFQFVVEKYELQLSEDGKERLKKCLHVYCMNMSKRWQKCSRVLRTFALKYNAWLQEEFKIPEENFSGISSTAD